MLSAACAAPRIARRIATGIARDAGTGRRRGRVAAPEAAPRERFPSFLDPRRRFEQALLSVVLQAFVCGVSTRGVDELVVELAEAREPARGPEAGLQVADRALNQSLLARCLGRAGVRVEGVVATQLREPRIPMDDRAT